MKSATLKEFIRLTRPDGKGHIYVDGKEVSSFEEVICDSCNDEINQPEGEPEKEVVLFDEDRAVCYACFEKYFKPKKGVRP